MNMFNFYAIMFVDENRIVRTFKFISTESTLVTGIIENLYDIPCLQVIALVLSATRATFTHVVRGRIRNIVEIIFP